MAAAFAALSTRAVCAARRTGVPARTRTRTHAAVRASESADDAQARRERETARVDERTMAVSSKAELDAALALAEEDGKLVIVEVFSNDVCDLADSSWEKAPTWSSAQEAKKAVMEPCDRLASTFSRVARDAEGVAFVTLEADAGEEQNALATELGVTMLPTVQFYKNGEMLYEHKGAGDSATRALGEGALYYGGALAGGETTADFITEVGSAAQLDDFLNACALPATNERGVTFDASCEKQLGVLDVSMAKGTATSMHSYPAVVALAKNTQGAIRFARLLGDTTDDAKAVMVNLNVTSTPTFIFYCEGKEVGRYAGSDRVKLMEAVLKTQKANGIKMPQPAPRKRMSIAEAKKIQQAKREAMRKAGIRPQGW